MKIYIITNSAEGDERICAVTENAALADMLREIHNGRVEIFDTNDYGSDYISSFVRLYKVRREVDGKLICETGCRYIRKEDAEKEERVTKQNCDKWNIPQAISGSYWAGVCANDSVEAIAKARKMFDEYLDEKNGDDK